MEGINPTPSFILMPNEGAMDEKTSESSKFNQALLIIGGIIFISMTIITIIFLGQMILA